MDTCIPLVGFIFIFVTATLAVGLIFAIALQIGLGDK